MFRSIFQKGWISADQRLPSLSPESEKLWNQLKAVRGEVNRCIGACTCVFMCVNVIVYRYVYACNIICVLVTTQRRLDKPSWWAPPWSAGSSYIHRMQF